MDNKFKNLLSRIENAKFHNTPPKKEFSTKNKKFRAMHNEVINFFSCIITCSIIGYVIDCCTSKKFIYTIIMFFIGIFTGIYSIMKKFFIRH